MSIFFHQEDRFIPSDFDTKTIKDWITLSVSLEKSTIEELNIIICSDEYLLSINKEYLSHDYYTDIITFQHQLENEPLLGDVFISLDRIKENANRLRIPLMDEFHRIIIHGVLHLLGYGDKTEEDKTRMTQKEDAYLSLR